MKTNTKILLTIIVIAVILIFAAKFTTVFTAAENYQASILQVS